MRKIFLGILLVVLLAGVTYIKVVRQSSIEADAYMDGRQTAVAAGEQTKRSIDSLSDLLAQTYHSRDSIAAAWSDSLSDRSEHLTQVRDSMAAVIAALGDQLKQTRQKYENQLAQVKKKTARASKPTAAASHDAILKHYKLAVSKLPADLSQYEYQVAVREVRDETATKFSISVDRLNQIRSEHNLDY